MSVNTFSYICLGCGKAPLSNYSAQCHNKYVVCHLCKEHFNKCYYCREPTEWHPNVDANKANAEKLNNDVVMTNEVKVDEAVDEKIDIDPVIKSVVLFERLHEVLFDTLNTSNLAVFEQFKLNNFNFNVKNSFNTYTLLQMAIMVSYNINGVNYDVVDWLLTEGNQLQHLTQHYTYLSALDTMVELYPYDVLKRYIDKYNISVSEVLQSAVKLGKVNIIENFPTFKAIPEMLFSAITRSQLEFIDYLVKKQGINPKKEYAHKHSLIYLAIKYDKIQSVKQLIKYFVDSKMHRNIFEVDEKSYTDDNDNIFHHLIKEHWRYIYTSGMISELLCVQNINQKNNNCDTPLHLAVESKNIELVEELVYNSAKINLKNKNNLTPLQLAYQLREMELEETDDYNNLSDIINLLYVASVN